MTLLRRMPSRGRRSRHGWPHRARSCQEPLPFPASSQQPPGAFFLHRGQRWSRSSRVQARRSLGLSHEGWRAGAAAAIPTAPHHQHEGERGCTGQGGSTAPYSSSRQHGTAGAGLTAPAQRGLLGAPWLPASRLHRPVLPAPGSQGETAGACARPGNAKRSGAQPCTKRCVPAALLAHGAKAGKQHCPVRDLPWPPSSCRRSRGAGTAAPSRPPGTAHLWVRGRVSTGGTTGTCTHSPVPTPSRCGGAAAPALHTHTHAAPVTQQSAGAQLRLLLPRNPCRRMGPDSERPPSGHRAENGSWQPSWGQTMS